MADLRSSFISKALAALDESIDDARTFLETCELEEVRHVQGQIAAKRETRRMLLEQAELWLRSEDDAGTGEIPGLLEREPGADDGDDDEELL